MADAGSTYSGTLRTAFVGINLRSSPFSELRQRVREIGRAGLKQLMDDVGHYWHREIMPKHFSRGNEQRYDMQPRAEKYLKGRKRRYGIGVGKYVLNVFSGQTLRRVKHESKISATSKQVTISMNVPTYFSNPYDPQGGQPDKVAELIEVNRGDVMLLNSFAAERLRAIANEKLNRAA